jgi:hypothetical protein
MRPKGAKLMPGAPGPPGPGPAFRAAGIRLPKARVSGASSLGNLDKAQRDQFADRRGDCVTMETELGEMLVRAREPAVLLGFTAMLSQLNL